MIVLLHMIVLWGRGEIFVSSQATSIPDIFSAGESGGSIKFGIPWPKQKDSSNPITALTYSIDGMQQVKISLDGAETSSLMSEWFDKSCSRSRNSLTEGSSKHPTKNSLPVGMEVSVISSFLLVATLNFDLVS